MGEPRDVPVIFQPAMVQALLRELEAPGTGKTMTRRHLYSRRKARDGAVPASAAVLGNYVVGKGMLTYMPPHEIGCDSFWVPSGWHKVKPGDRLWVRESHWRWGSWETEGDGTWVFIPERDHTAKFGDEAAGFTGVKRVAHKVAWWKRPSIFLPRELSRLTLVVQAVRIERLQSINNADCIAEGAEIECLPGGSPDWQPMVRIDGKSWHHQTVRLWFHRLWDSISGDWDDNPWVVAVRFTVHKVNVDKLARGEAA